MDRINKDSDSDSEMERIIAALSHVSKIIAAGRVETNTHVRFTKHLVRFTKHNQKKMH